MSLRNYESWMKVMEGVASGKSFQFLESYIGTNGVSKEVDYAKILNDPNLKANEGGILNEINFFEHLLEALDKDAREVSKLAEDLVAIMLQGSNSNNYGEADTIFSDVTMKNGEKVSVKTSKEAGFNKVLVNSKIKINQIFSIIFTDGLSPVTDKQKEDYLNRIINQKDLPKPSGMYSIAACYKRGADFVIEKTNAVSGADLLAACIKSPDKIVGGQKGRISAVDVLQNVLGFKPSETYIIKGISGSDIAQIANDRKIILKKIENLPTTDLRKIETQFNLK